MFLPNSRYSGVAQAVSQVRGAATVSVVRLRRLPVVPGEPTVVVGNDRLDVMADRRYGDSTRFWHIADANAELEAGRLVATPGRTIAVPRQ